MDAGALASNVIVLAVGIGLSFWAERARTDRSALVGLYLLFGIPGLLLFIWGVASLVFSEPNGLLFLGLGLSLTVPLVPRVRQLAGRITPIDWRSPGEMAGLILVLSVCVAFGIILINIGDQLLDQPPDLDIGNVAGVTWGGLSIGQKYLDDTDFVSPVAIEELAILALLELGLAYVAVGWLVRRDLASSTERLGIRAPRLKTIGVALGFLVLAYIGVAIGSILAEVYQPDLADQIDIVTDNLTSDVQNPVGAVILGACAGIGEEALFRGAIQPRYGILLTAATFALVHSQYGLSFVVLGLFLVGVALGIERKYFGTTAAMITHAIFNVIVVLAQSAS